MILSLNNMPDVCFLPGPMEGVMSPEFIRGANTLKVASCWITPFFRLSAELPRVKYFRNFLAPYAPVPVILQLMGRDPELLSEAARMGEALGVRGIDLNFGCPSTQVTRHGAGSALLKEPELAARILRKVRMAVRIPVSVKMRSGWDDFSETPCLLERILEAEPDMLTLHYRTSREQYRSLSGERERRFETASKIIGKRCRWILNGDYSTPEEMHRDIARFSASGAMAARGLMNDPGLLRRAAGLQAGSPEEMRQALFQAVNGQYAGNMPKGRAIELSILLWGRNNPHFARLTGQGPQ